jgi:hypothetical protein
MSNAAEEVKKLIEISRSFERPQELLRVSQFECGDLYLGQLKETIGDTMAFETLTGMIARIAQEHETLLVHIQDVRTKIVQVAEATQRRG